MNRKIVAAGSVLSLAVSAIGFSALSGCKSSMTALNSDMPNAVNGSLKGEYVLEQVKSNADNVDADAIRAAVQKDATAQAIFRGKTDSKDALPIDITVDCASKDANGGIAGFNNVFAFCTLTIWPCVVAKEYEYTVTASSVVGSHKVSFKALDRNWFGLSPFALIPVPGWSDERGDETALARFHAAQIALAAKEACAGLPNDYATFKRDQPKYLELISQSRSDRAFAAFLAAKAANAKVASLSKVVNASVIAKRQSDLIAAFKSNADGSVRAAILTKLNDGSFDKLPYDPTLLSYWSKLSNSKLLAMVYRDGYAKLSEADRKNLVAKISDDAVLTEMVTVKDDGLYVKNAKARVTLYQAMKPETVKKLADAVLAAHNLSDWNKKDDSALESVADMSVAVADRNVAAAIAVSLACKVDAYWRECKRSWSYRWDEADAQKAAALKKKIAPALTDDILVSKIKADRKLWSALSDLISDKAKVSALACGFVAEAATTGKEKDIKEAWRSYGDAISNDAQLMKLSVGVLPLRHPAFVKIKDDEMKAKTLAAIKAGLNSDLKKCEEKQGKLANLIAEISNGEELMAWIKAKGDQTEIQSKQAFGQLKGRVVVLKGDVREIGKRMFSDKLFVSLHVGDISTFEKMNVQFNIPDKLVPTVSAWQKGNTYVMRGKVTSDGDLIEDAKAENAEVIKAEDYDAAVGLKDEMDSIKWQLKEIEEKKMPPESVTSSTFGGAVKKAAAELLNGLLN